MFTLFETVAMQHRSSIVKRFLRKDLWSEPHGPRSFTDTNWLHSYFWSPIIFIRRWIYPSLRFSSRRWKNSSSATMNATIIFPSSSRRGLQSRADPQFSLFEDISWKSWQFLILNKNCDSHQKLWFWLAKNRDLSSKIVIHNFW